MTTRHQPGTTWARRVVACRGDGPPVVAYELSLGGASRREGVQAGRQKPHAVLTLLLPDRLLTHHSPPPGLVHTASKLNPVITQPADGSVRRTPTNPKASKSSTPDAPSEVARVGLTATGGMYPLRVGVTMSLHKLTAGSGYDYLTRQVAALDATEKGHTGLASYYTERGETPGVWIGSGLDGIDGLTVGDPVTAEQMRALFGCGLHPLAELRQQQLEGPDLSRRDFQEVTQLGVPFKIVDGVVSPFRLEVAKRIAAINTAAGLPADAPLPAADRARVRTEVAREFFLAEHGREPIDARELAGQIAKDSRPRTQTVAGYDLTFSPVKSVSTLWAVADPAVAAVIEQAHQAAVQDALAFIEKHALFTRTGPQGIRQVNVRGLVATAFTHRDSRAGDPDLHTHVAVANKVQTLDGRWLSIDGRVLFKANVAASETYNTALEQHLRDTLGVRFAERPGTDPAKRPIREIVGVDPRLNQRWSTRRAHIEARRGELAIQFQHDHGRPPTPVEALHLAQQATLETRDAKHEPRSLAEQRTTWLNEAAAVLGGLSAVASMVQTALAPPAETATIVDARWVTQTASHILAVMEASRSTWQMWHVRAEAQRQVRTIDVPAEHAAALVDLLVDEVLDRRSVALAAPLTASRNRRCCGGSTGRRSTPSPAPTSTPRSGSSTPRPVSSPRRDVAAVRPSSRRRSTWPCSKWRRTALHSMLGRPHWSARCAPPGHVCSSRSPPPAPGKQQLCAPYPGLDPRRRSGARPGPVGCRGRRPRRADRHPHRHPRQAHLVARPWRPAGLGGSGRPVNPGDHRRSRHGRHPLPRRRRAVRDRSWCECPAGRR